MTSEEIIERLRTMKAAWMMTADTTPESRGTAAWAAEAIDCAISALKGPTREQVEKMWKGEWIIQQDEHREFTKKCPKCGFPISGWWGADKFCANCGAPMTDEAVDMVMERLEGMKDEL